VLGAAAAVMIVLAGAGYGLASLAQQQGGATGSSAGAAGPARGSGTGRHPAELPNFGPASRLHVITSGTDYQPGTLARQAEQALTRHSAANSGLAQGAATPAGQTATTQQRACVMLVTAGGAAQLVDVARYQGRPATIIVQAPSAGKPGQVWVAGPACSAGHRDILAHTSLPSSG
jgi:hypothetical protein